MMMAKFIKTMILTLTATACMAAVALAEPAGDALSPYYNINLSVPTDRHSDYDPTKSLVNPVQNQGIYGTCWAFATVAVVESNIYKQMQQQGIAYNVETNPVKFSPWYLAWVTDAPPTDIDLNEVRHYPGGLPNGDYFRPFATKVYNKGGESGADIEFFLALGHDLQRMTPGDREALIAPKNYTESTGIHLENILIVRDLHKPENIQRVKELLTRYGAGGIGLSGTEMQQKGAVDFYRAEPWTANHNVALLGWDDEYDFSRSGLRVPPKNKGAWIVRNSWADTWADKGDGYVSYEDASMDYVSFYDLDLNGEAYDQIKTHENISRLVPNGDIHILDAHMPPNSAFASSYKTEDDALLTGVGFYAQKEGMSYSIKIYKDCEDFLHSRPEPAYHQEGVFGADGTSDCQGYRVVKLANPVSLSTGETYAVEVSLQTPDGQSIFGVAVDMSEIPADKVVSYINNGDGQWHKVLNHKEKYQDEIFQTSSVVQRIYLKKI